MPGEVTWRVPSLSLADEAIELFADRARRARPDFSVTDDNAAAVTEICRRLDGMPLAIELAAARVRALSLTEIVDSLHDRFRLLTGGARTAVRRQQTLRASVDWSHALLTEPERILFRRLAAFMGGFDLDAAQAVGGGADVQRHQVLDQLTLLVDKSLVVAEDISGRTRYRLLETVRQYALEKLGESGEADAVRAAPPRPLHGDGGPAGRPGAQGYRRAFRAGRNRDRQPTCRFRVESRKLRSRTGAAARVVAAAAVAARRPHPGRAGLVRRHPHRRSTATTARWRRRCARGRSPTRPCSTLVGRPRQHGSGRTSAGDRARTRRPGPAGPGTHRLRQRRRLRRRGGPAVLRRGDRPGPRTGRRMEDEPDPRLAGVDAVDGRVTRSRRARPPKKDASSPTPSVTASDSVSAAGGFGLAQMMQGDLTGEPARSFGSWSPRPKQTHDADVEARHHTFQSCACAGYQGETSAARAAAEAAIEAAAELGEYWQGLAHRGAGRRGLGRGGCRSSGGRERGGPATLECAARDGGS